MISGLFVYWIIISLNYILIATGLTLCASIMRTMNFAHGHIYMAGAFLFYFFLMMLGWPYGIALLLTLAIIGGIGIIIEMKIFRPLRHNINAQIVSMVALMSVFEGLVATLFGTGYRYLSPVASGSFSVGGFNVNAERAAVGGTSIVVIAALFYFVKYTKLGKALRATAQDRYTASLMGINVNIISSLTMGIGCAMAALAGVQVGAVYYIDPYIGNAAVMIALLVVVLGGMGSVFGACVGAFIIGILNSFGDALAGGYGDLLSFGVVILILLFRPTGLFGAPFEIKD